MEKIILRKRDEVRFDLIDVSPSILMELRDHFSFMAPNYRFHPLYKQKRWDGRIRLINLNERPFSSLYIGLFPDLVQFCSDRGYSLEIDGNDEKALMNPDGFAEEDAVILDSIPKRYEPRDYQQKAVISSIEKQRQIIVSSVGSGKSLMLYLLSFWFIRKKHQKSGGKVLIVVPTTSLVSQMKGDFLDYSMNSDVFSPLIHEIYSGKEKHHIDSPIVISTFQSLAGKMSDEWYDQFGMVIIDEAHRATAKSLIDILEKCRNCSMRIGTTGTIPNAKDQKINEMSLRGLIGPIRQFTTTKELQDKKQLAELDISCIITKHQKKKNTFIVDETADPAKRYQQEIEYLCQHQERNQLIVEYAFSHSKDINALVLFNLVEKHGKILFEMAHERLDAAEREIFFISGGTKTEEREAIRSYVEKKGKGCIIFASSSVFSTGINIKNLSCIIFAQSFKSQIRVIQSIGRGLRVSDNNDRTTLIDIIDDLHPGRKSKKNYTYHHGIERLQHYTDQQWNYSIKEIDLRT